MIKRGEDVHIAYAANGPFASPLAAAGARLHKLSTRGNYDPTLFVGLLVLLRQIKPVLVQTWLPQMDILGGCAALIAGIPYVMTERTSAAYYGVGLKNRLRIAIAQKSAAVVANSLSGRQYWLDRTKRPILEVIRNGIPFESISIAAATDSHGIEQGREIVVFAGRYVPEKNLGNLLEGLRIALDRRLGATALLFGEGPCENQVRTFVERDALDNRIRLMGFTEDLWSWLRSARVFVSVSTIEGNPNALLEAIAARCPVVVSDIKAHREFLCEDSAYLVPAGDPNAIAAAILDILSRPCVARHKAALAYEHVSRWSVQAMTSQYTDLYRRILEKSGAREAQAI
jgi:glycosyltransferase involved in cell wall biosynthesis